MGKKEKEHRRRVKARNERLKGIENARKKMLEQMFEQYKNQLMEESEAASATTENNSGPVQSTFNV